MKIDEEIKSNIFLDALLLLLMIYLFPGWQEECLETSRQRIIVGIASAIIGATALTM